ncbi:UNVERIFIED_CONTAM: hypothetical protein LK11_04570 [Mumia flava]
MAPAARGEADGSSTLAVGAVVRARVVARLLGVRLLRLDATVVVTPPVFSEPAPTPTAVRARAVAPPPGTVMTGGGLPEAERLLRLAQGRPAPTPRTGRTRGAATQR